MIKRLLSIFIAAILVFSLCGCQAKQPEISGTPITSGQEYNPETIARYEHRAYGIIIEYPSSFEKVGNFELDGYMTFENGGDAIYVYVPDKDSNLEMSVEAYTKDVLNLLGDTGSGIKKYGKTFGYKAITRRSEYARVDFVVKGVDAFYRFAYKTDDLEFTEDNADFLQIMESIRIDDGIYNKLTAMASRYKLLLEYATTMQYITDLDYLNHTLDTFHSTRNTRYKDEALDICTSIISEISEIVNYQREASDLYPDEWQDVLDKANTVLESCKKIEEALNSGNLEEAQRIARREVSYDLSEVAARYLSIIAAEMAEY